MFRKFLLLIYLTGCIFSSIAQPVKQPKVALVLSGGGAKGFAHLGVLQVLEKEGIPVDIIVGTSIGSIVGGLYAIGYTSDEIIQLAKQADWPEMLSDNIFRRELDQISKTEEQRYVISLPLNEKQFPSLPSGMVNGQNVMNLFCALAANLPEKADFTRFPIPFACVGTDLESGNEVIMKDGFLPSAIFSSMAIPGVFVPGKHNNHLLVDGGLVNNFPTDVAKEMGADIIIGVDLRKDLYQADEIISLDKLTNQIVNFYSMRKDSINKSLCDILIRPDITGYNTSSFVPEAVDTLMKRGIDAAQATVPEMRKLKEKYNLHAKPVSDHLVKEKNWHITNISFSGNYSMTEKLLIDLFNKEIPGTYNYEQIKKSINSLYGMGVFNRIYFKLSDNDTGKTLHLNIEESKAWNVNVGMRLNTRSGISAVVNSTRKDYRKLFGLLSFTADISANPRVSVLAEMDKKNLPKIALRFDGSYNDMTVHTSQNKYYQARQYTGTAKLYTYQPFFNYSTIGMGISEEFFSSEIYNRVGLGSSLTESYNHNFMPFLYGFYRFDSLDDYYFPTRGSELYTEMAVTKDIELPVLNPIWLLKSRNAFYLHNKFTLLLNAYGRTIFNEVPLYLTNFVASKEYELRFSHHLPFYGLPSLYATEKNTFIGCIELRSNVYKQHYIGIAGNVLFHNDELNQVNSYKSIWGVGVTYAFKSPVGPIEITFGYANTLRYVYTSANFGFWF